MGGIVCKRCHGTDYVKRGTVRNLQRYKCKTCGCNFTNTPARGKPPAMKALALMLYAMGNNMSFCSIARLLGVSDVAVLKWVRNEARRLPEPAVTAETVILTLDEMGHFLKKDLQALGLARV
jgi:transposase